jgi:hypothetical protein
MVSFIEAKATKAELEAEVRKLSDSLIAFPKTGPLGLTPDAIKSSPEYVAARQAYDFRFAALRGFNQWFIRTFDSELRLERRYRALTQRRASEAALALPSQDRRG